jgi:transposase
MMEPEVMERRRHGREFKPDAVRLVRDRGVTVGQASRHLGIQANLLRNWIKACEADPRHVFSRPRPDEARAAKIERLRREVQNSNRA